MNLYLILEVSKEATKEEIKKAYRKLAFKHHPDQGGNKEDFNLILNAYNVLSDEELREFYDKTGQVKKNDFIQRFNAFISEIIIPTIINTNSVSNVDMVERMCATIKKAKSELNLHIEKIENKSKSLQEVIDRLIIKKNCDDSLRDTFNQTIEIDKNKIEAIKRDVVFLDKCYYIVSGYTYKFDKKKSDSFTVNYQGQKVENWINNIL